jgi:hypothetical protein
MLQRSQNQRLVTFCLLCAVLNPRHRTPQLMARPAAIPGIPYGLEYLTQVDQLLVHQQVEIFEGRISFTTDLIERIFLIQM